MIPPTLSLRAHEQMCTYPTTHLHARPPARPTFAATESARETPWNEAGRDNGFYLDRHDLSCPASSVMTRFQLQTRNGGSEMSFAYTCSAPVPVTTSVQHRSSSYVPLTRYYDLSGVDEVACPIERPAMQGWRFIRNGNAAAISYFCANISGVPVSCAARSTNMNEDGGGWNIYLDRHNVKCGF